MTDEEMKAHIQEVKAVLKARPFPNRSQKDWAPILPKIDWSYNRLASIYDYLTYEELPAHCFRKNGKLLYRPPPVGGGGVWHGQEWRPGSKRYGKRGGVSLEHYNQR